MGIYKQLLFEQLWLFLLYQAQDEKIQRLYSLLLVLHNLQDPFLAYGFNSTHTGVIIRKTICFHKNNPYSQDVWTNPFFLFFWAFLILKLAPRNRQYANSGHRRHSRA